MQVGTAMVGMVLGLRPEMPPYTRSMPVTRFPCASFQRSRRGTPKRRAASAPGHAPAGRSARQLRFKFPFAALNLRFISRSAAGQSPVFALYEPVFSRGCVSRAIALENTLKRIRAALRAACRYTPRVHSSKTRGHCPWRLHISPHDRALNA